jgi:type IV secretory pathway VirB2 component (pilin)
MGEVEIYNTVRNEIITNHVLIHVTTLVVVILLLAGVWLVEQRKSVVSVLLPLLSLAWAAAIVRFDFFIHRQAAYLRAVEAHLRESNPSMPLWETWKSSLRSTSIVVPITDFIAILIILLPTIYLLFGPARDYFALKKWRGAKVYVWGVLIVLGLLICSIPFIPTLARN